MHNSLKLILLIWSFLIITANYAQNIICSGCNKKIEGTYLKIDNKYFHPEHFLCEKCGKIIEGNYHKESNKYYHSSCYAEAFIGKCEVCKKAIESEYIVKDGKKYHPECFNEKVALKCSICSKVINDEYFNDFYGNAYHAFHEKEYPKCDNCRRLICSAITEGGKVISDGRNLCNICLRNAVKSEKEINNLFKKVLSQLNKDGFKIIIKDIKVISADRKLLKKVAGNNYLENIKGFCVSDKKTIIGLTKNKSWTNHSIYILNNVPAVFIESTIAHELMHIWITQNTKGEQDEDFIEGSCNYLSYHYLRNNNLEDAKVIKEFIMKDNSVIYGDGFRKVLKKMQGMPLNHLLSLLRQRKSI